MRRPVLLPLSTLLFAAAACARDAVSIRGTLRDTGAGGPVSVWAAEAERESRVTDGAFELKDLTPGPITLLVLSGADTLGRMIVPDLPAGASLDMQGIRVDRSSKRAFPTSVTMEGARVVRINGIRMASERALPGTVDEQGTVLAVARDGQALVLRPFRDGLPDLRVVIGPATEAASPDGDPVQVGALSPGDTVTVRGRSDRGYVIATTLVMPRTAALREGGASLGEAGATDVAAVAASAGAGAGAVAAQRGRGDDRGRGRGGGKGRGKGKKN